MGHGKNLSWNFKIDFIILSIYVVYIVYDEHINQFQVFAPWTFCFKQGAFLFSKLILNYVKWVFFWSKREFNSKNLWNEKKKILDSKFQYIQLN